MWALSVLNRPHKGTTRPHDKSTPSTVTEANPLLTTLVLKTNSAIETCTMLQHLRSLHPFLTSTYVDTMSFRVVPARCSLPLQLRCFTTRLNLGGNLGTPSTTHRRNNGRTGFNSQSSFPAKWPQITRAWSCLITRVIRYMLPPSCTLLSSACAASSFFTSNRRSNCWQCSSRHINYPTYSNMAKHQIHSSTPGWENPSENSHLQEPQEVPERRSSPSVRPWDHLKPDMSGEKAYIGWLLAYAYGTIYDIHMNTLSM